MPLEVARKMVPGHYDAVSRDVPKLIGSHPTFDGMPATTGRRQVWRSFRDELHQIVWLASSCAPMRAPSAHLLQRASLALACRTTSCSLPRAQEHRRLANGDAHAH